MFTKLRHFINHTFFDVVAMPEANASSSMWIRSAIKRPGDLTRKAKAAGAITKSGHIDLVWARKMAAGGPGVDPLTAKQARFYLNVLRPMNLRRAAARRAMK